MEVREGRNPVRSVQKIASKIWIWDTTKNCSSSSNQHQTTIQQLCMDNFSQIILPIGAWTLKALGKRLCQLMTRDHIIKNKNNNSPFQLCTPLHQICVNFKPYKSTEYWEWSKLMCLSSITITKRCQLPFWLCSCQFAPESIHTPTPATCWPSIKQMELDEHHSQHIDLVKHGLSRVYSYCTDRIMHLKISQASSRYI